MLKKIYNNISVYRIVELVFTSFKLIDESRKKIATIKDDGSIVTFADLAVEKYLIRGLNIIDNKIPIISEEKKTGKRNFLNKKYWLIDPIDGTSNFINSGTEYTVNIALIYEGYPIFGIIGHPFSKKIWYSANNESFTIINNKVKKLNKIKNYNINPLVICSRRAEKNTNYFLKKIYFSKIIKLSSSLKFCYLAEGKADIYPRFTKLSKWDIAAGDAIIRGIGGNTLNHDLKPINYQTASRFTEKFFAINTSFHKKILKNI